MELAYLDTSALAKLVVAEPESDALRRALRNWSHWVSSQVAVVELIRLSRRQTPSLEHLAADVLDRLALHPLDYETRMRAARLDPPNLRSLDAIHLATALGLVPEVEAFLAYDRQLQEAAEQAGLSVQAPV